MTKYSVNFNSQDKHYSLFKQIRNDAVDILRLVYSEKDSTKNAVVSLNIINSEKIKGLNKEFRSKDEITDVLSFPVNVVDENTTDLGDIFINGDIIKKQSKEVGNTEEIELLFLFMHACLHLVGYDHKTPKAEKIMFAKQEEIFSQLEIVKND